jgi:hypothetical protein
MCEVVYCLGPQPSRLQQTLQKTERTPLGEGRPGAAPTHPRTSQGGGAAIPTKTSACLHLKAGFIAHPADVRSVSPSCCSYCRHFLRGLASTGMEGMCHDNLQTAPTRSCPRREAVCRRKAPLNTSPKQEHINTKTPFPAIRNIARYSESTQCSGPNFVSQGRTAKLQVLTATTNCNQKGEGMLNCCCSTCITAIDNYQQSINEVDTMGTCTSLVPTHRLHPAPTPPMPAWTPPLVHALWTSIAQSRTNSWHTTQLCGHAFTGAAVQQQLLVHTACGSPETQ